MGRIEGQRSIEPLERLPCPAGEVQHDGMVRKRIDRGRRQHRGSMGGGKRLVVQAHFGQQCAVVETEGDAARIQTQCTLHPGLGCRFLDQLPVRGTEREDDLRVVGPQGSRTVQRLERIADAPRRIPQQFPEIEECIGIVRPCAQR